MTMDMLSMPIFFFFISFGVFLILDFLYPSKAKTATTSTAKKSDHHGFKSYPFLGCAPQFLANRHRLLEWASDTLTSIPTGTTTMHCPGNFHAVITVDPKTVEHILKTNFQNYPKGGSTIPLRDFLGHGIFNADGDLWKLQRKTASYEFNRRSLCDFTMICLQTQIQTKLIPLLSRSAMTGRALDLQDVWERFTFDNICKLLLDADAGSFVGDGSDRDPWLMWAFDDAAVLSVGRYMYGLSHIWNAMRFLNLGSEKRLNESIRIVHAFLDKIIQKRLDDKPENHDFLSRFIRTGENSPELLRDVMTSFILAGRSTSSSLSWLFWLLSSHPSVVQNIRSEINAIRAKTKKQPGETFDLDELREMNYLHAVISETMRLYPPVPINLRSCIGDDVLPDGTKIKKGWFVFYHTYAMGRMESIWGKDCNSFLPERWLDHNGTCKTESPFRYPVFHAGPRTCLGKETAYVQMKSVVACVIEKFDVEAARVEKTMPEYTPTPLLRMKHGLPVRVKARELARVDRFV
ncbi:hypothetical protein Droror1_Dr00009734 [Drosera rotundifolia]